ncbi:sugar transferase [uncultured Sphaerochaeta sp.]|uniref:sugar transferase n=1 Tax=uncultured Sphaerochaeta sp. TaxID=886478 RepID=UPI002A0A7EF7|nr:sugar transferase [uncultured Sphaerochaeta sp.]
MLRDMYKFFLKRLLDFVLSLLALLILFPLLVVLGILVRVFLGTPVLFVQQRPGVNEKIFKLYKFRSMTDRKDIEGNLLPDEERLTRFGRFLRASSLDELPELVNILKGDMSIVGPRPLLVQYLDRYNNFQKRRHEVRPGITGLAQVNGRNALSWKKKFQYDVWYVDHVSFVQDVKIILQTIRVVLSHSDISSSTSATMEEFGEASK